MASVPSIIDPHREPRLRTNLNVGAGLICLVLCLTWLSTGLPLQYVLTHGFTDQTPAMLRDYYDTLLSDFPYWSEQFLHIAQNKPFESFIFTIATIGVFVAAFAIVYAANPYSDVPSYYGDTRAANDKDILKMEQREQFGIKARPDQNPLGLFGRYKGRKMRLLETVSVLVSAPPGTGKTAGIVVPLLLDLEGYCSLTHDIKPEIHDMVSGYLSTKSVVLRFEWSATDKVPAEGEPFEAGTYYPCWNPLSEKCLPPDPSRRQIAIENMINILIEEPKGGGDPFFTTKGRSALIGMTMYLVHKINILKDYTDVPAEYHGLEASFPMLLAWYYYARDQFARRAAENPNPADFMADTKTDNTKRWFQALSRQALDSHEDHSIPQRERYPYRVFQELSELASLPIDTRDSVLGTATSDKMNIFKTDSVIQRTSRCDFSFADMRGILKPGGNPKNKKDWIPVHLFICVNTADAKTMAPITSMLIDSLSAYTVAYGPREVDDRGQRLGPFGMVYVLDEFPQMKRLESVVQGPAVGRSKKNSFILICQDFAQIESLYDKPTIGILMNTTSLKVVLPQNNPDAVEVFVKMAGKYTHKKPSESVQDPGWGEKGVKFFGTKNRSSSYEPVDFFRASDISSLPPGKCWVLVQNFYNRPILADIPFYFKDTEMQQKVWNPRVEDNNFLPTGPMPAGYNVIAIDHYRAVAQRTKQAHDKRVALTDGPRLLIAPPRDIATFRRNDAGEQLPAEDGWWTMQLAVKTANGFGLADAPIEAPADSTLLANLDGRTPVLWDQATLDALNERLAKLGQDPIDAARCIFLRPHAIKCGQSQESLRYAVINQTEFNDYYDSDFGPPLATIPQFMLNLMNLAPSEQQAA